MSKTKRYIPKGEKGYDVVIYEVKYNNEKELSRKEISRKKIKPINQIVRVGTKETRIENIIINENIVPYKTIYHSSNSLGNNEIIDVQSGQDGFDEVQKEVTYINNIETSTIEINRIKRDPVNKIIVQNSGEKIASIGPIEINSLVIEEKNVYLDEWSSNKLTMYANLDESVTNVSVTYLLPNGMDKLSKFVKIDEGVYVADIEAYPSHIVGEGIYSIESIVASDLNNNAFIVLPEGNGFGKNYVSANFVGSEFEVKEKPLELKDPRIALNGLSVQINEISYVQGTDSDVFIITYTETNNSNQRIDQDSFKLYLQDGANLTQYGFFNTLMPGETSIRTYNFSLLKSEKPSFLEYGDVFFNTFPKEGNPIWDLSTVDFE